MTDLSGDVLAVVHRTTDTLLPGLVVTLTLLTITSTDLTTHSVTFSLVAWIRSSLPGITDIITLTDQL